MATIVLSEGSGVVGVFGTEAVRCTRGGVSRGGEGEEKARPCWWALLEASSKGGTDDLSSMEKSRTM